VKAIKDKIKVLNRDIAKDKKEEKEETDKVIKAIKKTEKINNQIK